MNLVNKRFREIRKELGYTQTEYAEILGIKRCSVGAYEENRAMIPIELFPKLMELGDVKKENLYDFIFNEKYDL